MSPTTQLEVRGSTKILGFLTARSFAIAQDDGSVVKNRTINHLVSTIKFFSGHWSLITGHESPLIVLNLSSSHQSLATSH